MLRHTLYLRESVSLSGNRRFYAIPPCHESRLDRKLTPLNVGGVAIGTAQRQVDQYRASTWSPQTPIDSATNNFRGYWNRYPTAASFAIPNDAIIWMSKGGSILGWSKGAERMYGSSEAEILGRSLSLLISLDRMLSYTCPATATQPRAFKGWFGKTNHSPWQSCDAKCDRHFGVLSRNELLLLDSQDLRSLVAIQHKKSDWADRRSIRISMVIRMLQVGYWPNPRSMSSLSMSSATCGLLHLSL